MSALWWKWTPPFPSVANATPQAGPAWTKLSRVDGVEVDAIDGTLSPTAFVFSIRFHHFAQMKGDELTKQQLSDMDPITMMMANAGLGIRSPESDAYLRAAFDRGVVNRQSHQNAAAVASQVARRVWKG